MKDLKPASVTLKRLKPESISLLFSGELNVETVSTLWEHCLDLISQERPQSLVLDLKQVEYCDGAGIALLQRLKKQQIQNKHSCKIVHLNADVEKLLQHIELQPDKLVSAQEEQEGFRTHMGHLAIHFLREIQTDIIFLGTIFDYMGQLIRHPRLLRWRDLWKVVEETGPQALPIVALIGFLIGLIGTFQAAPSFRQFGAQIFLVNLVGLGLVREMGPLMTAVLLAGRTASSFSAELGTMKINQEIDALTTMGLNSVRFLVLPRLIATMLMTPLLNVFFIVFGLLGCYVVMTTLGYAWDAFIQQLKMVMSLRAFIGGSIKVFVFGIVIASVGCSCGLKTRFGSRAVGLSTTQAVVRSLIMLVIVDGIFAVIYYLLKI